MKKIVREGVFESNSSSTHSLCICTKDEFEKWKNGELVYDYDQEKIIPKPTYSADELKRRYFQHKIKKISNGILYEDTYYKDMDELVKSVDVPEKELEFYKPHNWRTYQEWSEGGYYSDLERFEQSYTTPA